MAAPPNLPETYAAGRDATLAGARISDSPRGAPDEEFRAWVSAFRNYQANDPACSLCDGTGRRHPVKPGSLQEYSLASVPCDCNVATDPLWFNLSPHLPQGWSAVSGLAAAALERELRRELDSSHPLAPHQVIVVAHGAHPDDVLVAPRRGRGPVYRVHLTWSVESTRDWPHTTTFLTLHQFAASCAAEELD